ncbi:MAG: chemotaxis protein CheW [Spirochaetae bacterium HGW-Spirochaetae-7]|jgi:purine-binding chemotaxis protein CheW|nr:MAG: chemotaxis protein CheW [Spirochaetae bacterium HGW-Spirochaetae-7]
MADTIENQYLTFGIDGDTFGVSVGKVREVLEYIKPTKLPKTADFLKGLINVRDVGIPVVDLRSKFGLPEKEVTQDTAILVIEIEGSDGQVMIGAVADEVYEVIEIEADHLEPPPRFGIKIDSQFIKNVGKRDDKFIIILDLDKAFSDEEERTLEEVAPGVEPA